MSIDTASILGTLFIVLFFLILIFIITRELWCWYYKINARLEEQEKTNELLQNIYDALVQGNSVNAVTAGHIIGASKNGSNNDSDIPDL